MRQKNNNNNKNPPKPHRHHCKAYKNSPTACSLRGVAISVVKPDKSNTFPHKNKAFPDTWPAATNTTQHLGSPSVCSVPCPSFLRLSSALRTGLFSPSGCPKCLLQLGHVRRHRSSGLWHPSCLPSSPALNHPQTSVVALI